MTKQKTVNEKLDEILGLDASPSVEVVSQDLVPMTPAEVVSSGNPDKDMQDDYEVVRSGMRNLIEKTSELVDNANFFAKEKQDARSVEAATLATKEARENLVALLNMHKTRKDIERISVVSPNGKGGNTNITQNAVFVGTTGELLKFTKEMNANGVADALKALKTVDVEAINTTEEDDDAESE